MTSGDRFERLLNEHKDAVYRQMVRVCNHREDAEDALSGAMLQALRAMDQLKDDRAFRSWLATIGRRVCVRMREKTGMREVLTLLEDLDMRAHGEEMDVPVLRGCVKDAIDALPDKYRSIFLQCEIEEQTVAEAAKSHGISLAAAKSRLLRARAMIRATLDQSICAA